MNTSAKKYNDNEEMQWKWVLGIGIKGITQLIINNKVEFEYLIGKSKILSTISNEITYFCNESKNKGGFQKLVSEWSKELSNLMNFKDDCYSNSSKMELTLMKFEGCLIR